MSGHSKWANIKRQKASEDARRGAVFTKLGREIMVAAREGANPEMNFALRLAIERARAANMPKENIERAIKRGSGELKGLEELSQVFYEGYGPHGTAFLLQVLTDNRNRAVADVRRLLTRYDGRMGESGSVAWLFDRRGLITVEMEVGQDADELALLAIDAGADDVQISDGIVEIYTLPEDFQKVKETLEEQGLHISAAELTMRPKTWVRLGEKETLQIMRLIEALEELDDMQRVYSNIEISVELVDQYQAQWAGRS